MASSDVKAKIGKEDFNLWGGGAAKTFARRTSGGGTITLHKVGTTVDVLQVYGDGTTPTQAAISAAIVGIEGAECCLELAPGVWPITANLTIPATVTLVLLRGASLSVSAGVTLTLSCPVIAQESTWYSGAGTVTYTAGGGFFPLVDDLASTASGKGSRLIGVTGQTGKNVGDLFDGGNDVPLGCSTLAASGNATVGGTLGVTGVSTLTGNTAVTGTLDVTGQTTCANLSASGTLGGKLAYRGALVYLSVNQNVASGVYTDILFDSESYDTDAIHSIVSSTERLTVPTGVSRIKLVAKSVFDTNATGIRQCIIQKNGATNYAGYSYLSLNSGTGLNSMMVSSPVLSVVAGDYFTMKVYQNSGVGLDVTGGPNGDGSWFAMEIVE